MRREAEIMKAPIIGSIKKLKIICVILYMTLMHMPMQTSAGAFPAPGSSLSATGVVCDGTYPDYIPSAL